MSYLTNDLPPLPERDLDFICVYKPQSQSYILYAIRDSGDCFMSYNSLQNLVYSDGHKVFQNTYNLSDGSWNLNSGCNDRSWFDLQGIYETLNEATQNDGSCIVYSTVNVYHGSKLVSAACPKSDFSTVSAVVSPHMTQSSFIPVLNEIVFLVPVILTVIIGCISLRKGFAFIMEKIRGV